MAKLNYAGDTRDYWLNKNDATYNPATGAIVPVLSNNNKGYSMTITGGITLPSRKGLSGSVFYTFTDSKDVSGNPGSSAGSVWSNNYSINDPNELLTGYSQFGVPHRVIGTLSYRVEYAKHLATTVSLFYEGTNPGRFAYTYSNDINNDGVSLDLLYIPNNASDLTFKDVVVSGTTFTADQQRTAFSQFVENNKALKEAKGGYVKRNSGLVPWNNRFDFRLMQDIFTEIGKNRNTLQLSVDVLNIGNLINSNWGVRQQLNSRSSFNYGLLKVESVSSNGVPTLSMNTIKNDSGETILPTTPFRDSFSYSTTWGMQVGLRYSF